jgi:beta-RFAP synthase
LHRGLGGGTQLALAVAAGVYQLEGRSPDIVHLAAMVDRGRRSAVGSHGFVHGGLIWEKGRLGDRLAPLAARVPVPEEWRIVLVSPRHARGRAGAGERQAFAALPPVPEATTERLIELAERQILPAAEGADFARFADAVYEYGRLAGQCFAAVQGGPYASAEIAGCVAAIRDRVVSGVGQSSWGPTVFAVVGSASDAAALAQSLADRPPAADLDIQIAAPDNRGALVERVSNSLIPSH